MTIELKIISKAVVVAYSNYCDITLPKSERNPHGAILTFVVPAEIRNQDLSSMTQKHYR